MRPTLFRLTRLALAPGALALLLVALTGCEDPPVETTPVPDVDEKIRAVRAEVVEDLKQAQQRVIETEKPADAGFGDDAD